MRLLPLPIVLFLLQACDGQAVVDIENQAPAAPTVSIGPTTPVTGDDLVAVIDTDSDDPEGDAVTYSYSWTLDGLLRTDLTTNTVPNAETTKGEMWELTVTPNDGGADGAPASASVTIANALPTVTVAITPDAPVAGDDLQAVATAEDADGDAVTLTYAWSLDSAPTDIAGDTVPADQTSHGQRWAVTVTPADAEGAGTPGTAEVQIANSAPEVLSVTLEPAAPYVTDDVVAVVEGYDADADAITYTYTFFVDGTEAQSGDSDTLVAGSFAKHQRVSVEVVPNDGFDDGEAFVSADAEVQNSLPTATSVAIDPAAAYETSTLTCLPAGFLDADGDAEGWTYAWSVNGTEVGTTAMLDGASFNKGDAVTCAATPFDGEASGEEVTSSVTIANTAPALGTVAVSPSTGKVGDMLTCTASATDADAETPAISYTWSTGETGDTLTLTSTHDPGTEVTCTATATDSSGATSSGSASATVTNTDPVVSSVSVSPSTGKVGDVLTCAATATDADGGEPTFSYTWSTGAAGASLTLTDANNPGDVLTCTATATDADGGTATDIASATVSNTAPVMGTVSISPSTAYNDDVLTCSASATDADGGTPSLGYAWTNGSTGVALGSGDTLSLSSATAASRASIACAVTATDTDGGTATDSASLTLGNRSPVATVSLTPGSPARASTLTCSGSATDADADSASLTFTWTVGGSPVSASSTAALSSTLAGAFVAGQLVACTVTASDGKSGSDTDTASVTIGNTAPVVSSVTLSPSTVYTNGTLTANVVSSDADGDTLSLTYAWYVDGTLKQSGSSASLSGASYFSKGQAVYVTASASDGTISTSATSSSVTVSNTAPTAPVVEVTPADAVEGDDLTCTVTTPATDADGDAITYSFAWDVDGVDYASAMDSATDSVVDGADVGGDETWTCEVVAGDPDGGVAAGSASAFTTSACAVVGTEQCGTELAALSWSYKGYPTASCNEALTATSFGTTTASTALSACTSALDLSKSGNYATTSLTPSVSECTDDTTYTFELVGRLPTNYQRGLYMTIEFPSGQEISMGRWVWNGSWESSVDVNVSTATGTSVGYSYSNANTGGASNGRPWGSYIGNDGGWFKATLEVDTVADTITATVAQPSLTSTVYRATYALALTDGEMPTVALNTWGNCDASNRVTMDTEFLSFTTTPDVWMP